ncbi:hypothetical protein [Kitasatospora viridis]|uniref:Uncharacterized protein n=1 Tax=Kitasatospora viridis TaxID=281105 RepID=A0A561UKP6_9ACTN|nr:hypothetical protein [Kitasatospora viridis]TWF99915.1 hypothetical protein FHX73_113775 [Kitasatospora viridis]
MGLQNTQLGLTVAGMLTKATSVAGQTAQLPLQYAQQLGLGAGTGAGQADTLYVATRTLAASAGEDLDLAGTLVDALGNTINLARLKGLVIVANAANTNPLVVGNAAANGFIAWCSGATATVNVRPGGLFALFAPDATAYPVTPGTADLLHVANGGAGSSVTYDVLVIGSSA